MKAIIRKAELKDTASIVKAEQEIAEEPGFFCSLPSELSEQNVKKTIESSNCIYFVAEYNGSIAGHAFLETRPLQSLKHIAQLNIAVHKGFQNLGVGTQLIKKLIERAKQSESIEKIELNVRASNTKAISLYKKMGFLEEGCLKRHVKTRNGYIDDILMALHVKGFLPDMYKPIADHSPSQSDKESEKTCECSSKFYFSPAESCQIALIHTWLQQDHIKEWIHGQGLQNTLNGLESFFHGESTTTYWIGYHESTPFAFLITSPEGSEATTLDLFICDLHYLGKGLAVPMIHQFLINHFPKVKKVLIDPEATNKRAIHVYKKAGFKVTQEFIASWHPVPHYQMELYMTDLLNPKKNQGAN